MTHFYLHTLRLITGAIWIIIFFVISVGLFVFYQQVHHGIQALIFSFIFWSDSTIIVSHKNFLSNSENKGTMKSCFFWICLILDLVIAIPMTISGIVSLCQDGIGIPR